MLRSLFLLSILFGFFFAGLRAPFVFSLAYTWVSLIRPQEIAHGFIDSIPTSLLSGLLAIGSYILLDRKKTPSMSGFIIVFFLFAIWITFTTIFVRFLPIFAWEKWDWAFKNVAFGIFIIFVFRNRVQIEAFLQVYVFSLGANFIAGGLKVLRGGGGYGRVLGLLGGNSGLGEGATLAAVALTTIPIVLFLSQHQSLLPRWKSVRLGYVGLAGAALLCALGSYQRTALPGLAVLAAGIWLRSKRKALVGAFFVVVVLAGAAFVSDAWVERMNTIEVATTEDSALGRLLVWQWTYEFVLSNPLGGGFGAYLLGEITFPAAGPDRPPQTVRGKAFHSIYFEVLGEHGWPGLGLFLALLLLSFLRLQSVVTRHTHLSQDDWCISLAKQLQLSLVVLATCGAFIGIAFQPILYYLMGIAECLCQHTQRMAAEVALAPPGPLPPAMSSPAPALAPSARPSETWRNRRNAQVRKHS